MLVPKRDARSPPPAPTSSSTPLAAATPTPTLTLPRTLVFADMEGRGTLAFQIMLPIAGVFFIVTLCCIWGPGGSERRSRKKRAAALAARQEQAQRAADARAAAYFESLAVVRVPSSSSLPVYERDAGRDEIVLGVGPAAIAPAPGYGDTPVDSITYPPPTYVPSPRDARQS
ncbi:hypothetical protein CC85DRAFT_288607 [Cutaneotrichosporon oleaginosum]|uniref:Transmembrane protein n=1 Tax=Cutaneotrichosporon oleaginosum TaxID=879819 RepID=A0A0J1AVP1_9TREE|nr:uncharacterized protein CC85DRAFT_288607 [Cutaneotrichosporon oleaginosum]KLT39354.1 hypothetical protein CC85DRAFT_288607 [Cutaneotrichosporon oleaginosum]TXT12099.1 hypothetical protein COLE_02509 [Cutaneotrichosporon oleaginosum]